MATPRDRCEPRRGARAKTRGADGSGAANRRRTGPKRASLDARRGGADGFAPRPRTAKAETRSGAPPRRERPRGDSKRALAKRRVRRRSPPSPRDARRDARSIIDRHGEEPRRAGEAESSRHSWRCHFARGGLGRVITLSASHHQSHRSVSLAVASDLPRNPLGGFRVSFFSLIIIRVRDPSKAARRRPKRREIGCGCCFWSASGAVVTSFVSLCARSLDLHWVVALGSPARWTTTSTTRRPRARTRPCSRRATARSCAAPRTARRG